MPTSASSGLEVSPENELDLRPTVRAVVGDLLDGVSRATIAARFHATVVEATALLLELAGAAMNPVILTGGCFQNQLLDGNLRRRLGSSRIAPPGEVPVNDGGIALGQAFAAALALQRGDL
jgi:hydrogenase maturation protein HypF